MGTRPNSFVDRLIGLAATHDLLTQREWRGAPLKSLVVSSLSGLGVGAERWRVAGPEVDLPPDLAVACSLALHELGTNAIKDGALSNDDGQVEVTWSLGDPGRLILTWREQGGPLVEAPTRRGFGSELLSRLFPGRGGADVDFRPEGLVCRLRVDVP